MPKLSPNVEIVLGALISGPQTVSDLTRLTGLDKPSIASVISRLRKHKHYNILARKVDRSVEYSLVEIEDPRQPPKFFSADYVPCRFCQELVGPNKPHNPTCPARSY